MICDHVLLAFIRRHAGKHIYQCTVCGASVVFDKAPVVTQDE